jgi:D-aspartate ligase
VAAPANTSPLIAVVIGLNLNGLGTMRALAAKGVETWVVCPGNGTAAERTRHGHKVFCRTMATDPDALVRCLQDLARTLPAPAVVFPSGDLYLQILSSRRAELGDRYLLPFPADDLVNFIGDKNRFYSTANSLGIPIPGTWFPADQAALEAAERDMRYPVVIKPAIANIPWRERGWKILTVHSREELLRTYSEARLVQPDLIVQEVIPGPDSALQFSLTFADAHSQCITMFTGRKLRQYVPRFGISSLAESRWYPQVDTLTRSILQQVGYSGYASIEFKEDARDGRLYVMEITGRTWYPHALSELAGINLPWMIVRHMNGLPPETPAPRQRDGVKWVDEVNDLRSAIYYLRHGELTVRDWMASYGGELHLGHYRAGDTAPFYTMLRRALTEQARALLSPVLGPLRRRLAGGGRT